MKIKLKLVFYLHTPYLWIRPDLKINSMHRMYFWIFIFTTLLIHTVPVVCVENKE